MCLECVHPAKTSLYGSFLAARWRMLCLRPDGRVVCAGSCAAERKGGVYVLCLASGPFRFCVRSSSSRCLLRQHVGMGDRHGTRQRRDVYSPVAEHIEQADLNALPDAKRNSPRRSRSATSSLPQPSTRSTAAAPTSAAASATRACRARPEGQQRLVQPQTNTRHRSEWRRLLRMPRAAVRRRRRHSGAQRPSRSVPYRPHRPIHRAQHATRLRAWSDPALAEEMTDALGADQQRLVDEHVPLRRHANGGARRERRELRHAQRHTRQQHPCAVTYNTDAVRGVDFQASVDNPAAPMELIVRPYQWKGSVPFLRDFNRGAAHNELGMQAVEVVGDNVDGDFDGVSNELTIGDMTALAVYMAAQPRPTTLLELNPLGLLEPALTSAQVIRSTAARRSSATIGCATCHIPQLTLNDPDLQRAEQERRLPRRSGLPGRPADGWSAESTNPITFDLTRDQPDNIIRRAAAASARGSDPSPSVTATGGRSSSSRRLKGSDVPGSPSLSTRSPATA